jgi:C4-dicarboxylate-specific signal transduction histidine kinase
VLFEVEDQCGRIPPPKLAQLLEPYDSRGDAPSKLGPGLAICVRGAEALHGEIHVRNKNNGCIFTVDLPRASV